MQEQIHPRDMTFIKADGSGVPVWYLHPQRTELELADFQTPITNICRYNGGVQWPLVRHLALGVLLCRQNPNDSKMNRNVAAYYAMHDLHEAIVGDIVSGMKKHLPSFQHIENLWETHVHNQLNMPLHGSLNPAAVHTLDLLALAVEMTCLMHPAVEIVQEDTGLIPTAEELECFFAVQNMSSITCFAIIVDAIETWREEILWQQK